MSTWLYSEVDKKCARFVNSKNVHKKCLLGYIVKQIKKVYTMKSN